MGWGQCWTKHFKPIVVLLIGETWWYGIIFNSVFAASLCSLPLSTSSIFGLKTFHSDLIWLTVIFTYSELHDSIIYFIFFITWQLSRYVTETFFFFNFCSLGIIYGVFSFSNLLAPTVVAITGPQLAMFLSGILYR